MYVYFQIDIYEQLYLEVSKIETKQIFYQWLRVDINPFKQALLNTVCKWSNMLKQHLVNHVIDRYFYNILVYFYIYYFFL